MTSALPPAETGPGHEFIPDPEYTTRHHALIDASPTAVWPHVADLDVTGSALIRGLFLLRGIRGIKTAEDFEGLGFVRLRQVDQSLLVYGLIGQFWKPKGSMVEFEADEFAGFDAPDFVKAIATFELRPTEQQTLLVTETLIATTSEDASRRFRRYWTVIAPFSGVVRREWLRTIKRAAELG